VSTRPTRHLIFAACGIAGLIALWQWGYVWGGPFVLPPPQDTAVFLWQLVADGKLWQPALVTFGNVLLGFGVGAAIGLALGLLGGFIDEIGAALQPVSTIILGIPPIAWIVLALLWFGPRGFAPAFTVAVGIAPVIFAGALAGMRSAAPDLDELAEAFALGWRQKLFEIRLPQVAVALLPALATALGLAWKISIMAEVLSGGTGIGGKIADARAQLDLTATMGWIVVVVILLLVTDRLLARLTGAQPSLAA